MSEAPTQTQRPRFTIVSAVYNVARYLDDFIGSLEAQTYPHELIQVVAVDDGSTDDSRARLQRWQHETDLDVVVLTKENGGQASARNLGLGHATGEWVTFTDPDDRVDDHYFATMARFLAEHPETDVAAAAFWMLNDATGELTNTHPLRGRFADGDRVKDLSVFGDHFFGSAHAGFFRRSRLDELELRFDERVRPNFEDGHFTALYLLDLPAPKVGFVRSAHYHYRKRADGSSTLQRSLLNPDRYTLVLEHGYLDLLERVASRGAAPLWLQNLIVYELSWYLSAHDHRDGRTAAHGAVAERFHELLGRVVGHLEPEVVESFAWRRLRPEWTALLAHGYDAQPWHAATATIGEVDQQRRLVRLEYLYTGERPQERLIVEGLEATPKHAKVREIVSHGQARVHQRTLWVPSNRSIRLQLDGVDLPIAVDPPRRTPVTLRPPGITRALTGVPSALAATARREPTAEEERLIAAARGRKGRKYADAWVLIDRIHDADDSAEHLFHHLRATRPEINAWFVVEEGTPDWERLRTVARDRLVAFGSTQWKLLMLNARHLISSHADAPVVRPPDLAFVAPTWRFTFLQHGVIKDDLSLWLNRKPIDVFVTSTAQEHASICADGTGYRFTDLETVLTGLPRFDRLREQAAAVPEDKRDLVLVAPTWRSWLVDELATGSQRRVLGSQVLESEFVTSWLALLRDERLARACEEQGLRLAFLPHPNLQRLLEQIELPDHVEPIAYAGADVRQLVARAALLITDYSSMAFNAAYVERPVLYYQFDADRVLDASGHVGTAGYFDYARDGFGPVADTHDAAVEAAVASLTAGRAPGAVYRERVEATFPLRDGRCCERVVAAILASTEPVKG